MEQEISTLNNDLNRAMDLVTRQEHTLSNLRSRKKEDDNYISSLEKSLTELQEALKKLNQVASTGTQEHCAKNTQLEAQLAQLKLENEKFQRENSELKEREVHEKAERKRLTQIKLDMLDQRTSEVNRLSEVIESLPRGSTTI